MDSPPFAGSDICDAGAMVVAIALTAMAGPSQGMVQAGLSDSLGSDFGSKTPGSVYP